MIMSLFALDQGLDPELLCQWTAEGKVDRKKSTVLVVCTT